MGKINRHDLRLSDEMLADIEAIAEMNGAKVHHISKKPIIKDTVISLLELGIKAVFEGVDLPKKSDKFDTDNNNRIDLTVLDEKIEDKLKPLYSLISELTDKINRIANTNSNNDTDNNNRIESTDNVVGYVDAVSCAIVNDILSSVKEDNTESIALSECDILPLNEVSPHNVPIAENEQLESDIVEKDSELAVTESENTVDCDSIGTLTEAIDNPPLEKELTPTQRKVMEGLLNIPDGASFSQNKLAQTLGVSRSVLTKFEQWQVYFDFDGKEYVKK